MVGFREAAITSLDRSSGLATFSLDKPVGSTKCALVMPSAAAFAFMALTMAGMPPG